MARSWLQKMADEAIAEGKVLTFQFGAVQFVFGPDRVRYRELPAKRWKRDRVMERRAKEWIARRRKTKKSRRGDGAGNKH